MSDDIKEDLDFIKNELESLNMKVDNILDMLNNFTLMLIEETDDDDNLSSYDDIDDSWVPNDDDCWDSEDES